MVVSNNQGEFMDSVKIEVRLQHEKPVDIITMANSLIALNNMAIEHIGKECGSREAKLMLEGVREGSDIYSIAIDFGASILPMADSISSIVDFLSFLKSFMDIEKQSVTEIKENKHYNAVNTDRMRDFIAPVNEQNTTINITVNGDMNIDNSFHLSSEDVPKLLKNLDIINQVRDEKQEEKKIYPGVLIKMHKFTDTKKTVQDSAYCDDIVSGKAIPTKFMNNEDKEDIRKDTFNNYFLVDIEVKKFNGQVKLYEVLKVHNIIPIEAE